MEGHFQTQHTEQKRTRGRLSKAAVATAPQWKKLLCQRLFIGGSKRQYFAVISPAEVREGEEAQRRQEMAAKLSEAEYIRVQIGEALEQGN